MKINTPVVVSPGQRFTPGVSHICTSSYIYLHIQFLVFSPHLYGQIFVCVFCRFMFRLTAKCHWIDSMGSGFSQLPESLDKGFLPTHFQDSQIFSNCPLLSDPSPRLKSICAPLYAKKTAASWCRHVVWNEVSLKIQLRVKWTPNGTDQSAEHWRVTHTHTPMCTLFLTSAI